LIQIAHASLKIESTVGEGSTFTVTFPRSANE
jgi:signal transduction histidine kinase